jgi:hypothetical protein
MTRKTRVATVLALVTVAAIPIGGCEKVSSMTNGGVSDPLTPDQSKAQVIDAAKEIVRILDLEPVEPAFWRASCNDQGDAPFRGQMRIGYPLTSSPEASQTAIAHMAERLQANGWTTASDFASHGTTLQKNGVVAVFGPQAAGDATQSLELFGECRDVTTTKQDKGVPQIVTLTT